MLKLLYLTTIFSSCQSIYKKPLSFISQSNFSVKTHEDSLIKIFNYIDSNGNTIGNKNNSETIVQLKRDTSGDFYHSQFNYYYLIANFPIRDTSKLWYYKKHLYFLVYLSNSNFDTINNKIGTYFNKKTSPFHQYFVNNDRLINLDSTNEDLWTDMYYDMHKNRIYLYRSYTKINKKNLVTVVNYRTKPQSWCGTKFRFSDLFYFFFGYN
ncbi:MAG: hypothetical protein R2852_07500 [Bacteroidia bacterium]